VKLIRRILIGVYGVVLMLASASLAAALWSDAGVVTPAAVQTGGVSFAAEAQVDPDRQYATAAGGTNQANGTPVTINLPGSVIAQVLEDATVIWRFDVVGYALGIAGLSFDISYPAPHQDHPEVMERVLDGTTLTVYPAAAGGDCSAPVANPEPVNGIVTIADQVLQAPGSNTSGTEQVQTWCVELFWNADPPQYHTNVALAIGTGDDDSAVVSFDVFEAFIDYIPSLDPMGLHANQVTAEGIGRYGSIARDTDRWMAFIYPDATKEPDVPIILTPRATTVQPVDPGL